MFNQFENLPQIGIPKTVILEPMENQDTFSQKLKTLTFPVILKTRISSVSPTSHDMFIVQNTEALFKVLE